MAEKIHVGLVGHEVRPPEFPQFEADETTAKLYKDISPSIVKISGDFASGSGFFFNNKGDIATNAHVVMHQPVLTVTTKTGEQRVAHIQKLDDVSDLAIIRIAGEMPAGVRPVELGSSDGLKPGDRVFALGHPNGYEPVYISPGQFQNFGAMVDNFREEERPTVNAQMQAILEAPGKLSDKENDTLALLNHRLVHEQVRTEHGSSGGAVVDEQGKVVAITEMADRRSKDLDFAVPVDRLRQLDTEESKFKFTYGVEPIGFSRLWNEAPQTAVLATGLLGTTIYGLSKMYPLPLAGGVMLAAGSNIVEDVDKCLESKSPGYKLRFGVAAASDICMVIGGLVLPQYRIAGLVTLAGGFLARQAAEYMVTDPNVLTKISRLNGDPRPPISLLQSQAGSTQSNWKRALAD
jgi:hypothetical protein